MLRLFYIHGFLSGPNAAKARALSAYVSAHRADDVTFFAPDFPDTPREAFETLTDFFADVTRRFPSDRTCLVGSSMGGFLSLLLSQRFSLDAVLLNPCVHPQLYFEKLTGPQFNPATGRSFVLTDDMLPYLAALDDSVRVNPARLKIFIGDQDEVLDHSIALRFFEGCDTVTVKGADHAFTQGFDLLIPEILDFFRADA